jgi:hypothetical protein
MHGGVVREFFGKAIPLAAAALKQDSRLALEHFLDHLVDTLLWVQAPFRAYGASLKAAS